MKRVFADIELREIRATFEAIATKHGLDDYCQDVLVWDTNEFTAIIRYDADNVFALNIRPSDTGTPNDFVILVERWHVDAAPDTQIGGYLKYSNPNRDPEPREKANLLYTNTTAQTLADDLAVDVLPRIRDELIALDELPASTTHN